MKVLVAFGTLALSAVALFPATAQPSQQCSRNADDIKSAMVIQKENGDFCAVDEAERKKQQDEFSISLVPKTPPIVPVSKTDKSALVWQAAPKELGLQQLVNAGAIRPSTERDVSAWLAAANAAGNLTRDELNSSFARSYVVLKPIVAPAEMYGAHSREFFVPNGVPMPIDGGSHNSYFLIASGTCIGAASGCSR